MKKFLMLCLISTLVTACESEDIIYSEHKELSPDVEWLKKDTRSFEVSVLDNTQLYDMRLTFRYATGYQYQTVNVKVTETSPSGKESVNEFELKVRESNGDYIGEAGYDIWDSEHLVEANKKYEETGTYTYVIEQNTPVDPLNFAMEIGIVLGKSK